MQPGQIKWGRLSSSHELNHWVNLSDLEKYAELRTQRKSVKYCLYVSWELKKMGCKRERSEQEKWGTLVMLRLNWERQVIPESVQPATGNAYKFRVVSWIGWMERRRVCETQYKQALAVRTTDQWRLMLSHGSSREKKAKLGATMTKTATGI